MQIFLLYLFLFIVGCFLGWIIEVLFRRFVSAKKWVNPGFMKGPWLPLYGFGVVVMFTMCYVCVGLLFPNLQFYNPIGGLFGKEYVSKATWNDLIPISLMWIGMNLLEFFAGLIFIKGFRVKLWDYTNMKGNIMGIICPIFSFIWLFVAVIFYYLVDPFLFVLSKNVTEFMFGVDGEIANFGFIFALGLVYGIFVYDLVVSLGIFGKISKFAKESGILERYEAVRQKWNEGIEATKTRLGLDKGVEKDEKLDKIKERIEEAIYIDPQKEKNKKSNYDESGRPIKEE